MRYTVFLIIFANLVFSSFYAVANQDVEELLDLMRENKEGVDAGCHDLEELQAIEHQNPDNLAKKAISKGDLRYLGLMGYSVIVPNINYDFNACSLAASSDRQVRVIKGTSDYIACTEQNRLTGIAHDFALEYNLLILQARKAKGMSTCSS